MIVRSPVLLCTPKVAHHIDRALFEAAERARREGAVLSEDVARFISEVHVLAEEYRRADGNVSAGGAMTRATDGTVRPGTGVTTLPDTLVGVGRVAELAGMTEGGVRHARRSGRLPGQLVGSRYLFHLADVEAWMADRRAG